MKHTVVTSMSKDIYEGYGQDFLRTFKEHWPRSVNLVVYFDQDMEGYDVREGQEGRLDLARSTRSVAHHDEWMARIAPFPLMNGDLGDGKYSIQFDARQCRKAFIEAHAVEQFGGKVFWIDADVITHSDVPSTFLDEALPDDKLGCFLGRTHMYTESGFIGFNADHPACKMFMKGYRNVFLSGALFVLQGWHDCWAFDMAREGMPKKFFKNLAEHLPPNTMHPFISSTCGAYMDHRKGPRKETRSDPSELVIARSEPYWQKIILP